MKIFSSGLNFESKIINPKSMGEPPERALKTSDHKYSNSMLDRTFECYVLLYFETQSVILGLNPAQVFPYSLSAPQAILGITRRGWSVADAIGDLYKKPLPQIFDMKRDKIIYQIPITNPL